jgi:hypothetical protein
MSAAGRAVPANSVPNVNRVFSDDSYVHAVPSDALSTLNIPRASDPLSDSVLNSINRLVTDNKLIFSDVVPYGDDIVEELSSLISGSKVTSYTDLFAKVDDITRNAALRATGAKADEYELTYVQRVITDMLKSSGVDGLKNDLNTVVYDTRFLTAKYVHDVSDIVGDSADEVTLAVHNVNLLKRSYEAEPGSELLRVQLAEANAVAASKVRDAMSDELDELKQLQLKQINDVLDADTDLAKLSSKQRTQEVVRAQMKDDDTVNKFTRELDRGDWNGPCL